MFPWILIAATAVLGLGMAVGAFCLGLVERALRGAKVEVLRARKLPGPSAPGRTHVEVVVRILPDPERNCPIRYWTPDHLHLGAAGAPGPIGFRKYFARATTTQVELLSPAGPADTQLMEPAEVRLTAHVPESWSELSILYMRERLPGTLRPLGEAGKSTRQAPPAFRVREALELDLSGREGEAAERLAEVLSTLPPDGRSGWEESVWLFLARWRVHGLGQAETPSLGDPPPSGTSLDLAMPQAWVCLLARRPELARRWLSLPPHEPALEFDDSWRLTEDLMLYLLIRHQEGLEDAGSVQSRFERFLAETAPHPTRLMQDVVRRALWNGMFRPELSPTEALAGLRRTR